MFEAPCACDGRPAGKQNWQPGTFFALCPVRFLFMLTSAGTFAHALDPNKNDMDAREKYVPNVFGYTESDAKYTVKGTPYVYNPYCIFDTPKCK